MNPEAERLLYGDRGDPMRNPSRVYRLRAVNRSVRSLARVMAANAGWAMRGWARAYVKAWKGEA